MRILVITILLTVGLNTAFAQGTQTQQQTNTQLALAFYNAKDYEKAAPLLLDVYRTTRNGFYFRLYLTSLLEQEKHAEALAQLQEEIKKPGNAKPEFYIHWGYILKVQDKIEEAQDKFKEALQKIPDNKGSYLVTANNFMQWREFDWAKKTYLQGKKAIPGEQFNYELARVYQYLRDYDEMMEQYLNLVRQDEKQIRRVQSSLASAMSLDVDDSLRDQFRKQILRRIQAEPEVIGYNRLLIWFFLEEKKFSSALRQSVALDRRTGQEDAQIFQLAQMAMNSKKYGEAQDAYEYLLAKGEKNPFSLKAYEQNIHASYMQFINENPDDLEAGSELVKTFETGLGLLGYSPAVLNLIQDFAHLLAFYLDQPQKAISVLEKGMAVPQLKPFQKGALQTEMADVYVYANDPWEATLLYSQAIDSNKDNPLGDQAKLKKAKLGYFMGNFDWAKSQLDVLKASTSKLTANDAMDLSMLIGNNLNLDTTAVPLQMFSRADLLFFRNKDSLALATLDSIAALYPYHTLVDDILFRKAKIEMNRQNYTLAADYLEQIRSDFSYELLADDALYALAE
ncbi:MAG TPA: hypothetical protein VKA10_10710, partial [Prolixibacteraceae bacterium]|nr:hypothetical protein [Prolixibacteraceae bacterium]